MNIIIECQCGKSLEYNEDIMLSDESYTPVDMKCSCCGAEYSLHIRMEYQRDGDGTKKFPEDDPEMDGYREAEKKEKPRKTEQEFFDEYMRLVDLQDYNPNNRGGSKGFIYGRKAFDEVLALIVEMEEANLNLKHNLNKNFKNYFFKCKNKYKHPDTDEEIEISNVFSICIFNGFWMELRWG